MPSGVRVEGLRKTVRALEQWGTDVEDLKDTFGAIASKGAELAASFAPKRSGRLAQTIRGNRAKNVARVTAGRARVKYAGAINYGWEARGIKPALFMQKADTQLQTIAVDLLQDGLQKAIEKAGLEG